MFDRRGLPTPQLKYKRETRVHSLLNELIKNHQGTVRPTATRLATIPVVEFNSAAKVGSQSLYDPKPGGPNPLVV